MRKVISNYVYLKCPMGGGITFNTQKINNSINNKINNTQENYRITI